VCKICRPCVSAALAMVMVLTLVFFSIGSFPVAAADFKCGDVNGDNTIDSADYTVLRQYLLGKIADFPSTGGKLAADICFDGEIDSGDFTTLRKYLLEQIKVIPYYPEGTTTPAPTKNQPYPGWDRVHTGYATCTGTGFEAGISLLDPIPTTMEITAVNKPEMNDYGVDSALSGAYIEVTGPKGSTVVYVTDCYTEAGPGALDMCRASCDKVGDTNVLGGKIDISWRVIAAPTTGNFVYRIIPGSSMYWLALQVRNHKYPVMKMEYYENGEWIALTKDRCNYFPLRNLTSTTLKLRITDIRGEVVTDDIELTTIDKENGNFIDGNTQFPD
jgi:expansin